MFHLTGSCVGADSGRRGPMSNGDNHPVHLDRLDIIRIDVAR